MIKKLFNKFFSTTTPDVMSFQQSFDLTGLPIVTLKQGDRKFNFILDTGANNNIIDKRIVETLDYTPNKDIQSNLSGLEGIKNVVPICNITFSYKDKEFPFFYLINDMEAIFNDIKQTTGVTLHGILGASFFDKYKYVIDFNELIAYSKA